MPHRWDTEQMGYRIGRVLKNLWIAAAGEKARVLNTVRGFQSPARRLSIRLANIPATEARIAEHFRTRTTVNFFVDPADKDAAVATFRERHGDAVPSTLQDAEALCAHRFSMLGVRDADLGSRIDWQADFKSGVRWSPRMYHKLVGRLRKRAGADIKVPWELSRFQHVPTLGKAYWLTGDEKYAREFCAELTDWIGANPPRFGVNWACTMDVAIRACNWVWGWYFFKNSPSLSDQFAAEFIDSLWEHGHHIANNLEILNFEGKTYKNNHYLADIAGLVYLGLLFPEFTEARSWLDKGIEALEEEMQHQVCDDGVNYELSIPYHRLDVELFLYPALLCRLNGIELSERFWRRLSLMLGFIAAYTKPDGLAPQIGDADDGRLHILSNYRTWDRRDHRYLLDVAEGSASEEAFWITEGLRREGRAPMPVPIPAKTPPQSQAFSSGGYYVLRDADHYMIVNAGGVGTDGLGGHKHCDVLSFELCIGDTTFIADPGTYCYSPDPAARDLFRSTALHNTAQVDDREQNPFSVRNLFLMREAAWPRVCVWESDETHDFLDAEHYGFCRYPDPVIHRRRIFFDKARLCWIIVDGLTAGTRENPEPRSCEAEHDFALYFHFGPEIHVVQGDPLDISEGAGAIIAQHFGKELDSAPNVFALTATGPGGQSLGMTTFATGELDANVAAGWVSPSYGVRTEAPVLRLRMTGRKASFVTLLHMDPNSHSARTRSATAGRAES